MTASLIVLSTTETDTLAAATRSYGIAGETRFPHLVLMPGTSDPVTFRTSADPTRTMEMPASPGRPRGSVFHVDILGYGRRLPDPNVDESWWPSLSLMVRNFAQEVGCPLVFPKPFVAWDDGHGPGPHRLTDHEWTTSAGIVGVQHVPGAQSGQPGDLSTMVDYLTDVAPLEEPPGQTIQAELHRAGVYSGPQNGHIDAQTAEAVSDLAGRYLALVRTSAAQRAQLEHLVEEQDLDVHASETMERAKADLRRLVALLYGPDAARRLPDSSPDGVGSDYV